MSEIVHLDAYRRAIFRGTRGNPVWDPADIAECEAAIEREAYRQVYNRSIDRSRGQPVTEREAQRRASFWDGFDPDGGRAA